jgi:hypothetical protein
VVIPKGALFIVTIGKHANYRILTVLGARADLHTVALMDEYITAHPDESHDNLRYFQYNRFVRWLITNKPHVVEEINYGEWRLGDYYFDIKTI